MYMIGHQYICMKAALVFYAGSVQCFQIILIIFVCIKRGRSVIPTLYDVDRMAGQYNPWLS